MCLTWKPHIVNMLRGCWGEEGPHLPLLLPKNHVFSVRTEAPCWALKVSLSCYVPLHNRCSQQPGQTPHSSSAGPLQSAPSCYLFTFSVSVANSTSLHQPPPAAALWALPSTGSFLSVLLRQRTLFDAQYWSLSPRLSPLTHYPMPRDRLLRLGHEAGVHAHPPWRATGWSPGSAPAG